MKDAPVVQAMQRLSGQYPRFGTRRVRVFLGRESIQVGKERCARLWCEAELQVPAKPRQNGTNESFNGKFRDECLSME